MAAIEAAGKVLVRKIGGAAFVETPALLAYDAFDRADGAVGGGWTDLASGYPYSSPDGHGFDPAGINGGTFGVLGSATFTGHDDQAGCLISGTPNPDIGVGNVGIHRALGRTDGVEIGTWWRTPVVPGGGGGFPLWKIHQVGPATHVAGSTDTKQMGLKACWDVTFAGSGIRMWFCHPVFRALPSGIFDTAHHDIYDGNAQVEAPSVWDARDEHLITMRAAGGRVECRVDGQRVWGPIDVPAWAEGRDGWGIALVDIIDQTVAANHHARVTPWFAREWTTDLGPYPAPVSFHTGTTTNTTGSTLTVSYPDTAAGDLLSIYVAIRGAGSITAPAGFTLATDGRRASPGSGVTLTVLTGSAPASGAESGSVNVGVSGHTAAVMVAARGTNPVFPGGLGSFANPYFPAGSIGTSATPTTGGVATLGPDRSVVWVAAVDAALGISPPTGFETVAETGTGGPAVNLAIARCVFPSMTSAGPRRFHAPHNPCTTVANPSQLVGNLAGATSAGWVTAVTAFTQDPR